MFTQKPLFFRIIGTKPFAVLDQGNLLVKELSSFIPQLAKKLIKKYMHAPTRPYRQFYMGHWDEDC